MTDSRFSGLPKRPGKIIAVHLSYGSRADQRGRRPDAPSYFYKTSSSVAGSGAELGRPSGIELLAFEGEIALVIGEPAYRVSLEDAWKHVEWITASNDFGMYDLRSNDKGSNVRNKSGDGFTPIGPELIPASDIDPDDLRIRTWVNGELVQEGHTSDLLFPLAQFVADLSQHFTLEAGDVILTGTPAGSSVVAPGDVVEVEVDTPDGKISSGRLTTPIVEGHEGYDSSVGSLPTVNDAQRIDAWGSPKAAGITEGLSPEFREKLEKAPVATLSQMMRQRGLNNVHIDGVFPQPDAGKIVGTAKTLRFVPNREDLFKSHGGGYNAQKRAFDSVKEGEVVVIEARGVVETGTLGDILAIRARSNGAAGIITDGGVRDYDEVNAIGVPVYSKGPHPAVLGRRHVPWDHDITIACGGATVQPGDIIVADSDGVVVIPPAIAEEVVDAAIAKETEDGWVAERVAEGGTLGELFPMNAQWRERYNQEMGED